MRRSFFPTRRINHYYSLSSSSTSSCQIFYDALTFFFCKSWSKQFKSCTKTPGFIWKEWYVWPSYTGGEEWIKRDKHSNKSAEPRTPALVLSIDNFCSNRTRKTKPCKTACDSSNDAGTVSTDNKIEPKSSEHNHLIIWLRRAATWCFKMQRPPGELWMSWEIEIHNS